MCVVAELRGVDVISSHQFEEEIGAASSENGLLIAKMEFSVRTTDSSYDRGSYLGISLDRKHESRVIAQLCFPRR